MKRVFRSVSLFLLLAAAYVPPAACAPDYWDSRLTTLGVYYTEATVPAGQYYWRLVSAVFLDEAEAGGTHHIYYKCLNASGSPIQDQKCWQAWPTSSPANFAEIRTKGPGLDDYWGNAAMYGGWCPFYPEGPRGPYGAYVDGLSDQVWGMGLPCNRHVSYRLTWRWTQASGGVVKPAIEITPEFLSASAIVGGSPPSQTFTVRNSGGSTLSYSIQTIAQWLSVTPQQGTSTGESDTITVSYQTGALAQGAHSAAITVSDTNASNSPRTLPVTLSVSGLTGENLLVNPSFEFSGGSTAGWTGDLNTVGNNYPHPGGAKDGAKWVGSSCGYGSGTRSPELRQTVTVVPGRTYQISAWANTSGSPNPCSAFLDWFDGADPGGTGLCTTAAAFASNTSGWQKLSAAVTPSGDRLTICLRLSWSCSGAGGGGNFDLASVSALYGDTVPAAKKRPDYMAADLLAKPVTAAFADHFYVQEPDRTGGIMVRSTSLPAGIGPGWSATASGVLRTDAAGERYLSAVVSAAVTGASPVHVCLLPGNIGGADWQYQSATGAGQRGVAGGAGLNNTGLLVCTWGRVASAGSASFVLDGADGSRLKCLLPAGVPVPAAGTFVILTGISSRETVGGLPQPLLKLRSVADILAY